MFKSLLSKAAAYLIILVFVIPVVIIFLFANASRKNTNDSPGTEITTLPGSSPSPSLTATSDVPLPSKEDVVRVFCELIDEGRIPEAVSMMVINNDTDKQSWGVYLNSFSSFKLVSIKKSAIDETGKSFEVDVDTKLKNGSNSYGWVNGVNKRWINVVDDGKGHYKIQGIATGP